MVRRDWTWAGGKEGDEAADYGLQASQADIAMFGGCITRKARGIRRLWRAAAATASGRGKCVSRWKGKSQIIWPMDDGAWWARPRG